MTTSRRRLTAFLVAGALLAGACSDGGEEEAAENPKQAFTEALDAFADYEGITLEMTVDADAGDIASADTPEDVAEKILNSSIVLSTKGQAPEDTQFEMRFNVDGNEDAATLRVVGSAFYARVEVPELVDAFGGDMAEIDAAVEQASAAGFDFARAAVDGEWVGVEGIDELAEQFGLPMPTPDPEKAAALQDRFVEILESNAEVTSEGTDDVGARLRVALPLKQTAGEFLEALQTLGGAPAGTVPLDALNELPTVDVPIAVWISDGRLVQVEIDAIAIGEALGEEPEEDIDRLAFRLAIDEFTDEVEAPDDFVAIDLQQILQGVFGAGLGATTPEAPALGGEDREIVVPDIGLACEDLQGVPPAQIKTFLEASGQGGAFETIKQECPELF